MNEKNPLFRDFPIRRTELTCPGHSMKMMTKAATSSADQVIFDLEDACAVSQKEQARKTIIEALTSLPFQNKIRAFRPNNIHSRFFYRDLIDVVETAGSFIDVIVLPKINNPEEVHFADILLTEIEENMGFEVGRIKLEVLIESAEGVLHAEQIAKSTPRLGGLIFGLMDFAGDIGAQELGSEQFFYYNYAKAKIITAARAASISAIDGVTIAIRDLDTCRRDAQMAARMGFDGKWAIHPDQIDIINESFSPTQEEVQKAQHILTAYEQADKEHGLGAIVIDDQMVDAALLRIEWKKLAIARKIGMLIE